VACVEAAVARPPLTSKIVFGPCPLCGRASDHLHLFCHRMIHRVFSERELAGPYADPEVVRGHPDIARFIAWVRRQPPEYVDWPKEPRKRR
jgi:hypothetical protein